MIITFITETIFLSQYDQNEGKKKHLFFLIFRHYYQVSHLVKFQQINSFIIKLLLGVFILRSDIGPSTYRIQIEIIAGLPTSQPGQPLFVWLSRDWPSVRTRLQIVRVGQGRLSKGRKGCLRRVLASPHLLWLPNIHNMV